MLKTPLHEILFMLPNIRSTNQDHYASQNVQTTILLVSLGSIDGVSHLI